MLTGFGTMPTEAEALAESATEASTMLSILFICYSL